MIDATIWTRFMAMLVVSTRKDEIIWENTMLNIHETKFHGDHILTDWERDEPPMISVSGSDLQMHGMGIEHVREAIDEQYKRLKKYRYSEDNQLAQATIAATVQAIHSLNNETLIAKATKLLALESAEIVCNKCGGSLSELGKHVAVALGVEAPLCEKCNPYINKLSEADRKRISLILLGK